MKYFLAFIFMISSVLASTPQFLVEDNKVLTIEEVQSLSFDTKENNISNWGYSNKTFWLKLGPNQLPQNLNINTLEIKYPLEYIEYYYFNNGNYDKLLAGEQFSKTIAYKNTILPLSNDRSKPIFFRIKSRTAIQFDYKFWQKDELLSYINNSQFGFGLFYGINLFAILFSLITYFWLKDKTYLYMSIFLVFYCALQMAMNRFGQQFLWPNSKFLNLNSVPIFSGLAYGSFLIFMASLLDIRKNQRGFLAAIYVLLVISVGVSVAPFILTYRTSMLLSILYMTFVSIFIFVVGYLKYRKSTLPLDRKVAKLFVISWTPFVLGILTLVVKVLGIIPANFFTNYLLQMGSIISIFMFVVITGEKFKSLREQKEKSDKSALNAAFAKERVIKNNSQIVHDIRSPLSALEYYINTSNEFIPKDQQKLGHTAFRRLEDIINNLSVSKSKGLEGDSYLVSEVLQDIVSEKRYEHIKDSTSLSIDNNSLNHALFLKVNLSALNRSLSNILNNAYESEASSIQLQYGISNNSIEIKVTDNGKGIDKSVQNQIFEDGYTSGKENGTGIGLSYVKGFVDENNGSVSVESSEYGTTVKVTLPKAESPIWFSKSVNLFNKNIVIIDDEISIYNLWVSRFKEIGIDESKILYLSDPKLFKVWALTEHNEDNLYLVDYEYVGSDINGLNLIAELGIYSQSILVTSRYSNESILNKVKASNLKMIPKFCIQHTELINEETNSNDKVDLILIDDDSLVRSIWSANSKRLNQTILCFETIDEFLVEAGKLNLSKDTPIYIDSQLGEVRGEIESERVFKLGFYNLVITTGYSKEDIDKPHWIKDVISKQPVGLNGKKSFI